MQPLYDALEFEPVRRESARQKVHFAIREAILAGKLKVGQRLAEIPLAKQFNVSRAVIREALQQLVHDGLVEQNAFKGSRVVQLSPEQVDEIVAARLLIEVEMVRLAKERMTQADKQALMDAAKRLQKAVHDPKLFAELDLAFHEKIWELAGNATLRNALLKITAPLFAMGSIMRYSKASGKVSPKMQVRAGSHATLAEVICKESTERAARAMRAHITENSALTREDLEEFLSRESKPQRRSSNPAVPSTPARRQKAAR